MKKHKTVNHNFFLKTHQQV